MQGILAQFNPADLSALGGLLKAIFFVAGVLTIGHGIWKLVEASQPGKQEGSLGLRSILIGGALMSLGPIIGAVSQSFGMAVTDAQLGEVIDFAMVKPPQTSGSDPMLAWMSFSNTFVNMLILFGYWSVGKGLLMLKKTSDGAAPHMDEGVLSGITHILFGSLLVNIRSVLPGLLVNFIGFPESMVSRFFV